MFALDPTQQGVPTLLFVRFRQLSDPIEKIRHFKTKNAKELKGSTKNFFSIHSKTIFALERKQEA